MKTLEETIEMVQESHDAIRSGGWLDSCGLTDDELDSVLYYLENYKKFVDSVVNIIVAYKDAFKTIIEEIENEDIGRSDKG